MGCGGSKFAAASETVGSQTSQQYAHHSRQQPSATTAASSMRRNSRTNSKRQESSTADKYVEVRESLTPAPRQRTSDLQGSGSGSGLLQASVVSARFTFDPAPYGAACNSCVPASAHRAVQLPAVLDVWFGGVLLAVAGLQHSPVCPTYFRTLVHPPHASADVLSTGHVLSPSRHFCVGPWVLHGAPAVVGAGCGQRRLRRVQAHEEPGDGGAGGREADGAGR